MLTASESYYCLCTFSSRIIKAIFGFDYALATVARTQDIPDDNAFVSRHIPHATFDYLASHHLCAVVHESNKEHRLNQAAVANTNWISDQLMFTDTNDILGDLPDSSAYAPPRTCKQCVTGSV